MSSIPPNSNYSNNVIIKNEMDQQIVNADPFLAQALKNREQNAQRIAEMRERRILNNVKMENETEQFMQRTEAVLAQAQKNLNQNAQNIKEAKERQEGLMKRAEQITQDMNATKGRIHEHLKALTENKS